MQNDSNPIKISNQIDRCASRCLAHVPFSRAYAAELVYFYFTRNVARSRYERHQSGIYWTEAGGAGRRSVVGLVLFKLERGERVEQGKSGQYFEFF